MIQYLDARGKQCPLPLILAKQALEKLEVEDFLEVSVDNEIAMENLEKMAVQKGLGYTTEVVGSTHYKVTLQLYNFEKEKDKDTREMVVVLSSDKMGEGVAELGQLLLKGFIYALTQIDPLPTQIIMYNSGAKLAVASSEVVQDLQYLEQSGVKVMTCGTCLDYYGIADQLEVGTVTNMYDIAEALAHSGKIIKP
ncbi:MAG: sulfurtransferase-like selenium metabolism protein YedF [Niameybacter sp.]|uniref:sulfurtransferase-like selenium metabolism protein YedF n=1 Tax=Niameybacter sp. TaxID=2033640 RepID=UPI002FC68E4A